MTPSKFGDIIKKHGATKTQRFTSKSVCRDCEGLGTIEVFDPVPWAKNRKYTPCLTCGGNGIVVIESIVNIFPHNTIYPKQISQ
ncbi:MAG: hypothetical protein JXR39_11435 [Marinilabiliaceae bacterium]|nr:hypothetical protein [Marinilabiliaceae bacterium]